MASTFTINYNPKVKLRQKVNFRTITKPQILSPLF